MGVAVVGAAATAAERDRPLPRVVNGRAEPRMSALGQPERWWGDRVAVTLDGSLEALGPAGEDAVIRAFGNWGVALDVPGFVFDSRPRAEVPGEPDGENRVYYAPIEIAGHEQDLAITVSYVDNATGEILEADVIVNSRHRFAVLPEEDEPGGPAGCLEDPAMASSGGADSNSSQEIAGRCTAGRRDPSTHGRHRSAGPRAPAGDADTSCSGDYDLQSVVTHEAGHFLGLGEDPADREATMYPRTTRCETKKRDLEAADISSISALYAGAPPAAPSAAGTELPAGITASCAFVAAGGRRVPLFDGWVALAVGAALSWATRRARTRLNRQRVARPTIRRDGDRARLV